jgi:chromosome partitioning protein
VYELAAMLISNELFKSTHVVVLGNEKGGSGKSTTAIHVITALLARGKKVGSIDLDARQQSLTRYLENREDWARRKRLDVTMPEHYTVSLDRNDMDNAGMSADQREELEFGRFAEAISKLEHKSDFIVIDTPGSDNPLNRLGHSMADTLITPINDSFVDLDVIAHVEGENYAAVRPSQYAAMVKQARLRRNSVDGGSIDWIVIRNRLTVPVSHNNQRIGGALKEVRSMLGFRLAPGVGERVIFRELFPKGLTLFDTLDDKSGVAVTMSHLAARQEVHALLASLNLPVETPARPIAGETAGARLPANEPWLLPGTDPDRVTTVP